MRITRRSSATSSAAVCVNRELGPRPKVVRPASCVAFYRLKNTNARDQSRAFSLRHKPLMDNFAAQLGFTPAWFAAGIVNDEIVATIKQTWDKSDDHNTEH